MMFFIYGITVLPMFNDADWDLWARLAVGSIFFHSGKILMHDIFAYTSTKSLWVDHEWGSGVIFYTLSHFFGDYGLLALKFLLLFFIFLIVYAINQNKSDGSDKTRLSYYILFLFAILPGFDNTLRSQFFTYFFFVLWLYLLDLVKKGNNKVIWLFPATMVLWANLHGGFLAGIGAVILFGVGEALNKRGFLKYFAILGLSTIATLINPYGIKYWYYLADAVTMPRPFIPEWLPLNLFAPFSQYMGFKIFAILTLISFIYLIARRFKTINWAEIFIICATFYMALKHVRHIIFFVLAAGAYIYYYFYPAVNCFTFGIKEKFFAIFPEKIRNKGKILRDSIVYGLIIIVGLGVITVSPRMIYLNEEVFPTKAVKFIQINHLSGNLLVLFNWGSYALWKLYPQDKIAVDGRYEEVYPESLIDDVARFHYVGVNWDGLLNKYHTDLMLIPVTYDDLFYKISRLKNWKIIYQDNVAAVFIPKIKDKGNWKKISPNFDPSAEKYNSDVK